MLPNVLQPSATDHVPVLADEVRELLAVQPGETVVDATFGAGGHAALLAVSLQGSGKLITASLPPGRSIEKAAGRAASSDPSSSLTAIRKAWKTRFAG